MSIKKITNSGFTLVELMVVVAIIGILSAIAIPNFKKYQAKSKTTEAKLQLAALYTAEISFSTDYDAFATCLSTMGYDPSANKQTRYYAVGFDSDAAAANLEANQNGAPGECVTSVAEDNSYFPAGKKVGGNSAGLAQLAIADNPITNGNQAFLAVAAGILDPNKSDSANCDKWSINQEKTLKIEKIGY